MTTLVCINQIYGQTFQYSRGWTNGKRSGATTEPPSPGLSLRQMIPNSLLLTANELNNRERYGMSWRAMIRVQIGYENSREGHQSLILFKEIKEKYLKNNSRRFES